MADGTYTHRCRQWGFSAQLVPISLRPADHARSAFDRSLLLTQPEARRIAAVTGGSRGIGRAVVWDLARRGFRVFALARAQDELRELEDAARAEGLEIQGVPLEIADHASRQDAAAAIFEATDGYGLDVLVNNAGYGQFGPLEDIPIEKFRRQMEVNLVGLLAFTQPFLPTMRARRRGWIVNVSSAAGRTATPFMGAYNASKFGLEGMSDALRMELHPFRIHVVLIAPGPIRTEFGRAAEQVAEQRPGSAYAPYMQRWKRTRGKSDLVSRSPEAVARAVRRAVQSDRPRPRYTITASARLGAVARRLVPDTITDWVLRHAMGLP
jgi:NAD(P)-dependent dehydrogenase (short-subunit alcohol dehydrogenase family)